MAATFHFKLSDWAFPIAHNFNTIEEIDLEYGHYDGYNTLLAVTAMFLSVKGKTYLTTAPQQWLVARYATNLLARSVLENAAKSDTSTSAAAAAAAATETEVASDSVDGDKSGTGPHLAEASITPSFVPESEEAELSFLLDELSIVREDSDDENDDDVVGKLHRFRRCLHSPSHTIP
ncbi:hypothetical protein C8J56DRAFT_194552 [Mycena floridula]|nr:hypothetical protein C8J56DRAFT_194552 [Mycena floridula]